MAHKEIQHYTVSREWERYLQWKKSRNKDRALLEEKFGFGTKHAAHLVRLIRACIEILETCTVISDRTGIAADELKVIQAGVPTVRHKSMKSHSIL